MSNEHAHVDTPEEDCDIDQGIEARVDSTLETLVSTPVTAIVFGVYSALLLGFGFYLRGWF